MNDAQRVKEMEAIIKNLCEQIEELKYKNELLVNRLEVVTGKKAPRELSDEALRNVTKVTRTSDQSITIEFTSCRSASEFARAILKKASEK